MNLCHKPCIRQLEGFFDSLQHLDIGSALDVAAGDGIVTRDLLGRRYETVDCFDRDMVTVRKLEEL